MSDTMRDLFPGEVRFVGGENPSDRKLTNWATMEKDALTLLAQAVGNIWNADKTLQGRAEDPHPLLFTNLTRAIGNLELLNPSFLYGYQQPRYAQQLQAGRTEHSLDYWVDLPDNPTAEDLLDAVYSTGSGGETKDGSLTLDLTHTKLTPEDLSAPGDWTVLGRTLYTYSVSTGGYFIFDAIWKLHDIAASFSVIPNLSQAIADGAMEVTKVVGVEETYYILTTPDYLYDYEGDAAHVSFSGKQIPLPKICQYGADQLIPEGLVTIWDLGDPVNITNAQKIEGALFYGYGDEYNLVVKNVTLEENDQRYILVCAAEGLAYAIRRIRDHLMDIINGNVEIHDSHNLLRDLRFTGQDNQGNQISGWFSFPRSRVFAHDHTMYLHRMGYDPVDANIWGNAMLGDLMMASSDSGTGWINLNDDSRKIQFGSASGPTIYYSQADDALMVDTVLVKDHDHSGNAGMGELSYGVFQVKVDADDVSGGYLEDKLLAGDNIEIAEVDIGGGVKKLRITAAAAGELIESSKVKVDSADTTAGYLSEKILAGDGISIGIEVNSGVKNLRLASYGLQAREAASLLHAPNIAWVSNTQIKVECSTGSPAGVVMSGFPNFKHHGQYVDAGLCDYGYRENTTGTIYMDFTNPTSLWGTEQTQQWYMIYATSYGASTTFVLKAMPLIRVFYHSNQVIQTGIMFNGQNSRNFGFTTNEFVNGYIYVLSGTSAGKTALISANTGNTITYSGSALTINQGDILVILPNTNFRFLGTIYNQSNGHIRPFYKRGSSTWWQTPVDVGALSPWDLYLPDAVCLLASRINYVVETEIYIGENLVVLHNDMSNFIQFGDMPINEYQPTYVLGYESEGLGL